MKFKLGLVRWRRASELLSSHRRLFRTGVVVFALIVLWLVIYRDFIFGGKTLLYKDIGSDSITVSFPYYVLLSDYLREIGIPLWSFRVGMGQNIFPLVGTVLVSPVVWLPKGMIAQALVYQHLIYLAIAGVLFGSFLSLRGLNFAASLLGALLLSFPAYMCMGSCWYFHATEVVCFTFLLFATEQAVARGHWFYLALAVALVGLFSVFHLYLCALFLCFYVPARLFDCFPGRPWVVLRSSVLLAAVAVLGVGLTAVVSLGSFHSLLNSPRGSGTSSYANTLITFPVFGLETPSYYLTAILRAFSNDIAGIGDHFRGWNNYLEAPMAYSGLLCLLLVPQAFIGTEKRKRILYGLLLLLMIVPVVFPWFRYLFWLFQGDYFRTFSLFSVFGMITLSMTALYRYSARRTLNLWLLSVTSVILLTVLYLPFRGIDFGLRKIAILFLFAYVVLLAAGRYFGRESICTWVIIGLCAAELCFFDRITVAYRSTVMKQDLKERVGYNDSTVDVLRDIKAGDGSFYRITKLYPSGNAAHSSLNDAMVFGYYGTMSYSSFNNLNYVRFLMAVDSIPQKATEIETRWAYGLIGRSLLSTFACEKYVLSKDPVPFQTNPAYESFKRYGKLYVFRNRLSLPLGLFYPDYISEKMFLELPSLRKERALLLTAVLSDDENVRTNGLPRMSPSELQESVEGFSFPDAVAVRRNTALRIRSFTQNCIEGTVRCDTSGILVFQTAFDRGWRALIDGVPSPTLKADVGLLGVKLGPGEHTAEIRYSPPFLRLGVVITAISTLILGVAFWRWPRISVPSAS